MEEQDNFLNDPNYNELKTRVRRIKLVSALIINFYPDNNPPYNNPPCIYISEKRVLSVFEKELVVSSYFEQEITKFIYLHSEQFALFGISPSKESIGLYLGADIFIRRYV